MASSASVPALDWLQAWSLGRLTPRHWLQALALLAACSFLYCLFSALNHDRPFHATLALAWGLGMSTALGLAVYAYRAVQRHAMARPLVRRTAIAALLLALPLVVALGERALATAYWDIDFALAWSHYHGRLPLALLLWVVLELPGWLRRPAPAPAIDPPAPVVAPAFEVSTRAGPRRLAAGCVDAVHAAGNYVELRAAGQVHLLRETLSSVDAQLASHGFVRVHRSHLVRAAAVAALLRRRPGGLFVRLDDGSEVPVGRAYQSALREAVARLPPRGPASRSM
jgi:hypothetical protein